MAKFSPRIILSGIPATGFECQLKCVRQADKIVAIAFLPIPIRLQKNNEYNIIEYDKNNKPDALPTMGNFVRNRSVQNCSSATLADPKLTQSQVL